MNAWEHNPNVVAAMRNWAAISGIDATAMTDEDLAAMIAYRYAGGVKQFLADIQVWRGASAPKRRSIYVASSWRNPLYPNVVRALRAVGHRVYDSTRPDGHQGFKWHDAGLCLPADPAAGVRIPDYLTALHHPSAVAGFDRDYAALRAADAVVLVLPCGRSAHLELGWAVAAGKRTAVLLDDPCTPELMYRMVDRLSPSLADLLAWLDASGFDTAVDPTTNERNEL